MRSIWKGALTFGLINIPVSLHTATKERELKFTLLHKKDLSQIRFARFCKAEEKEVPYADIVRGFEIEGKYVVLTEEDFAKANLEKTSSINIIEFTDKEEIDPMYFDKPYFLQPDKKAAKAYNLLRQALQKAKKVAVVRYVLKNHEHLGIVMPNEHLLILNQLRLHSEILQAKDIEIPNTEKISSKEMEMAMQLIEQQTGHFRPEEFKDTYTQEIMAIIKQKAKTGKVTTKGKEIKPSKVVDIMGLLKESLDQSGKAKKASKQAPKLAKVKAR